MVNVEVNHRPMYVKHGDLGFQKVGYVCIGSTFLTAWFDSP